MLMTESFVDSLKEYSARTCNKEKIRYKDNMQASDKYKYCVIPRTVR
jgi:hypothetical protein